MSNPLFNQLNQETPLSGLMNQLEQFRNNFNGDPKEQVQQLLNSGKMTQSQFEQLSKMATQLQSMMKR